MTKLIRRMILSYILKNTVNNVMNKNTQKFNTSIINLIL